MNEESIIKAHQLCRHNKLVLEESRICGCFFCLKVFDPQEIKDWCDNGKTAICPNCGIDSIIPRTNQYPINKEFLTSMKKYWFF